MENERADSFRIKPRTAVLFFLALIASSVFLALFCAGIEADASVPSFQETDSIRIGERLSYVVSLDGFGNVGYADLMVVSRGRIEGRDAFEVRFKVKTFDVVNAVFFPLDEVRTAYLDAASGLPFSIKRVLDPSGFSQERSEGVATAPSALDLISLIYKVRRAGGDGKFRLSDGKDNFWVVTESKKTARVVTDAGTFEAAESALSSGYLGTLGISQLKVYLSTDEFRVPALVTFKTRAGAMTARLTGITLDRKLDGAVQATPSPVPAASPVRPRPTPVKTPYVENRPLGEDLPFALGERLVYRVKSGDLQIGKVVVEARERKFVDGSDSLLLLATVGESIASAGIFSKDDYIKSYVNPGSLLPFSAESRFRGSLDSLNFSGKFDQAAGVVTQSGSVPVTIASNTHTVLSLLFAARSFNLRPSKSAGNPVNDTRVSVWWNGQGGIFTVRPLDLQTMTVDGAKITAQQVALITGNPKLDSLNIRVWITSDSARLPLKITAGIYSAELVPAESRSRYR